MKLFKHLALACLFLGVVAFIANSAADSYISAKGRGGLRTVDIWEIDSDGDLNLYHGDIQLGQSGSAPASATANTYPCITIPLTNQSGAAVAANSLVISSAAAGGGFSTGNVTSTTTVLGVAYEAIAAGAVGDICIEGITAVKTSGTVKAGDVLVSSATGTAGYAGSDSTPTTGADIGVALEAASGDGTALILLR